MNKNDLYFIIDFDSTFVQVEALDELANIALRKNPRKKEILEKIKKITKAGMEGKIPFNQSLKKRIKLFETNKKDLNKLIRLLKRKITVSIARNKEFFRKYHKNIYIISGGFKEYILPLFKPLGIDKKNILANEFIFDSQGKIIGFDKKNLLSQDKGKIKQIKTLNLPGKIYVIGDSYTDYQIKEAGLANNFFVFCENIKRDAIIKKADRVLPNFDEFLYLFDFPRSYSYPKNRIKVLLLENINQTVINLFFKEGYQVETLPNALNEDELIKKITDISILGIRSRTKVTNEILVKAKKLLAIGAFCIGTNQIDLKTASQKGITVFNAPYSNTRSVVEIAIGEIIMLYRRIFEKNKKLHQGIWDKLVKNCFEIRGKKLGIIGYGNIGSQLSVLAENLGMEVYFYDAVDKLALGNAIKCESLKELLGKVNVVTLHVDGRETNKNLIGYKEFKLMKDKVLFLNLSRGFVVDIKALADNIKNGKIAGAAIDVFTNEPRKNNEKFICQLQNLPNVILTPHIAGNTEEAQKNIGDFVTKKIIDYINTGNTMLSVNFPNIQLPQQKKFHRLIHIHQNIPGILAKINSILGNNNINIEGQYLKTNENIGYVITDVNKKYNPSVMSELKKIPGTIRFRILY
ncbi:phosphoglycerate dehydrogenase [Candidatus Roizmanbacteria bacterium CG03_land_8_20_14_0_80_35_26]|uniref:D-3-phosphoglycerate dehydrogenase n=1 Tax=Candidatus Roizmanbacteria bacterium CG03_land_8_20_14_0_80_35_26 TaxID=1974845 RepID=A0A2M7BWP8_9BACT|nr:MAG: phosphoglycerate dehydrogenase [Candidatus Roizmanbacteria bacterium CG03_land_8_20_14_0_80_35_26]PJC80783.1 MAG: phosphoglycerate dehydrogenase [Candidatus Roizmanbacteria bacterium CG_4_8_14_3_um_filter_36_12]